MRKWWEENGRGFLFSPTALCFVAVVQNPSGTLLQLRCAQVVSAADGGCGCSLVFVEDGNENEQMNCQTLHASRTALLQQWLLFEVWTGKIASRVEILACEMGCCWSSVLLVMELRLNECNMVNKLQSHHYKWSELEEACWGKGTGRLSWCRCSFCQEKKVLLQV